MDFQIFYGLAITVFVEGSYNFTLLSSLTAYHALIAKFEGLPTMLLLELGLLRL